MPASRTRRDTLARLGAGHLDIHPRTRLLILVAGLAGVVLIIVGSLWSGGREQYIGTDKIVHFGGYFVLSSVFVLALRPRLYVPALIALFALGISLEYLQASTGRTPSGLDQLANAIGVAVGGAAGLLTRRIYRYIRTELAAIEAQKNLRAFDAGAVVFSAGDKASEAFVVHSGKVRLHRVIEDGEDQIVDAGPGDMLSLVSVVQGVPQYCTARALEPTAVFAIKAEQLLSGLDEETRHPAFLAMAAMANFIHRLADLLAAHGVAVQLDQAR